MVFFNPELRSQKKKTTTIVHWYTLRARERERNVRRCEQNVTAHTNALFVYAHACCLWRDKCAWMVKMYVDFYECKRTCFVRGRKLRAKLILRAGRINTCTRLAIEIETWYDSYVILPFLQKRALWMNALLFVAPTNIAGSHSTRLLTDETNFKRSITTWLAFSFSWTRGGDDAVFGNVNENVSKMRTKCQNFNRQMSALLKPLNMLAGGEQHWTRISYM